MSLKEPRLQIYYFRGTEIFLHHQDQVVIQQQYPSLGPLLCQEPIHCIRRRQINNQSGLLAQD